MTQPHALVEDLGQPAMAEAQIAEPVAAAGSWYIQEVKRLEADARTRHSEIVDLKGRIDALQARLDQARGGHALAMPQPLAEPWPQAAKTVIGQLKANLATMEAQRDLACRQRDVAVRRAELAEDRFTANARSERLVGSRL